MLCLIFQFDPLDFHNKTFKIPNNGESSSFIGGNSVKYQIATDSESEALQWIPLFPGKEDGELNLKLPITKQFNVVELIADDSILDAPSSVPENTELPPIPQKKDLYGKLFPVGCNKESVPNVQHTITEKIASSSKKRKRESNDKISKDLTKKVKKAKKAKKAKREKKNISID